MILLYEKLCAIWYHLYNEKDEKKNHGCVKKMKISHGGALHLVKLKLKVTLLQGPFSRFLNQPNSATHRIFSKKVDYNIIFFQTS